MHNIGVKKYVARFSYAHLRLLILVGGAVFAWTTVLTNFSKFYKLGNTLLVAKSFGVINPALTPCFWGSLGFLAAIYWSYKLLTNKQTQKYFTWFLVGCNLFAWSVFGSEVVRYMRSSTGTLVTCSGAVTSPLQSSCFVGALFFLSALVVTVLSASSTRIVLD